MASPWPRCADEARMEMIALASRVQELLRSQQLAQQHRDWETVARLRGLAYNKAERIKEIGREARQGSYQAIGFPLNEEE